MQDSRAVYRKTPLGQQALAVRQGLTPRQRTLLILVDGRRGAAELASFGTAVGDVAELLDHLLEHGYVERVVPAAPPPPAAPPAPAGLPLPRLRTQAVRRLTDLAGPAATDMCLRLEKAASRDDLMATLHRLEAPLSQLVGTRRAAAFLQEIDELAAAAG